MRAAITCTDRPNLQSGEHLPLLVMLHGCGQTGRDFALSTRMKSSGGAPALLRAVPKPCRAPVGANLDGDTSSAALRAGLEDLLGDLWHARRQGDMGRLALVLYCEVRRWARLAGEKALAQQASALMLDGPLASREEFLAQVDRLIGELEDAHGRQV